MALVGAKSLLKIKMLAINEYPNFNALSDALSKRWLALIADAPVDKPCSFALAGGTTPEPLYRQFDALFFEMPSRSIQIVATDERWVPDSDPQSNEGLFRRCFNQSAPKWHLLSLKNGQPNPASAVVEINTRLQINCPHPFNAIILGMGTDGHIASLFPNAPDLLIGDETVSCVAALHPQTGQARISLSFSRLLNTKAIWLIITGAEKRTVLEKALRATQKEKPHNPIGALLAAARSDVQVFWCA